MTNTRNTNRDNANAQEGQSNPPNPITAAIAEMQREFRESQRKAQADMMTMFREQLETARVQILDHVRQRSPPRREGEGSNQEGRNDGRPEDQGRGNGEQNQERGRTETQVDRTEGQGERVVDTGKMLLNFKKHDPPTFDGSYDPIAAAKWLQDLERIFEVTECQDRQKLLYSTYLLKGDAREWWATNATLLRDQGREVTWQMFEDSFLDKYFPRDARDQMHGEFERLTQGGMSVDAYLARFNELAKYANFRRPMPDSDYMASKFLRGLNEKIEDKVMGTESRDMVTIVNLCRRAEEMIKRRGGGRVPKP